MTLPLDCLNEITTHLSDQELCQFVKSFNETPGVRELINRFRQKQYQILHLHEDTTTCFFTFAKDKYEAFGDYLDSINFKVYIDSGNDNNITFVPYDYLFPPLNEKDLDPVYINDAIVCNSVFDKVTFINIKLAIRALKNRYTIKQIYEHVKKNNVKIDRIIIKRVILNEIRDLDECSH